VYPRPEIEVLIGQHFVPVKIHIKEQPAVFERFNVQWTPVMLVLDSGGVERHRWEGFLPADEFRAQLELALAQVDFGQKRFEEAARRNRRIVAELPATEAAAAAQYWAGVATYKATNDPAALQQTAAAFKERYSDSVWAKKASVWG
jgi:hypothetical protein